MNFANMEIDLVERLGEWVKLIDPNTDPNEFVGRDVCVRIIHYVPLYEITHSKNYVAYNAPTIDDLPMQSIVFPR